MITLTLIIVLIILQALDLIITRKILANGGRELNPIMQNASVWIPIKLGITALCAVSAALTTWLVLVFPVLLMAGVCTWNLIQLKK